MYIYACIFVLFPGTVEVVSEDGETVWARLSAGQFFGELALIFHTNRLSTVRAITKARTKSFINISTSGSMRLH